ncbi:PTS lactose/cellobiose transporter subunit IIA [Lederbergia lenta]|uniref:PTS system lactose/cellobiose-specific transporter subunit IIA n=1 Tax=Lederbergia lenta TaxID=1467 RepID=A0A2X4WUL0_LEDLE|nr:PTS lactose/cellobiose transporter subunit IIA [Lederbergia lenta]MCM3112202.1 PTS lactose/cellobiose transporter subunit IIA [Lederbergia lenta]MEC2323369.1 PTS lactose/cellobiose transporter subunit IIA [Lederbergia lenta]SQI63298.1 PTS system lactose/cellobiose-specific transporter subunit IIA [Lederbergia lenta]
MTTFSLEEISFQIILHAGNARSSAMEAIHFAKTGDFDAANDKIKEADEAFVEAHHSQTKLLQAEATGEGKKPTVLLIHAQDHLMTAMTMKEMAQEFIDLYKRMEEIKK